MWFFSFGKRNTAKLLATGQLTSYGSGTGVDDGALKKGIVKRYTILTTGQYSGTTGITINSKTDTHSNNCVFDEQTGLMWSRYCSASVGPASNGKIPWTTTGSGGTAEGIFAYVAAANAASLGGYTDWRIPNIFELLSIADYEATTAQPDSTAFPGWPSSDYFFTATTTPSATTSAMLVFFSPGTTGLQGTGVKTGNLYCALVRG
jgi:hypothetical protein